MKFLEQVFDPLGDKQVPLMALATSAAGEVGGHGIAADFDCELEFDAQGRRGRRLRTGARRLVVAARTCRPAPEPADAAPACGGLRLEVADNVVERAHVGGYQIEETASAPP
jgi:hypothetical protein